MVVPGRGASASHAGGTPVHIVDSRAFVATGLARLLSAEFDIVPSADELPATGGVVVLGEAPAHWHRVPGAVVVDVSVDESVSALCRRIRGAARSRTSSAVSRRRVSLSDRENAVLLAAGRGESAAQIAADLGLSVRTVERHRRDVMRKLGVRSQAHAVARSIELGVLRDAG